MADIKKSKLFLGITLPILAFFLMSHNAAAIVPLLTRTVKSITFNVDSTSTPTYTVNSMNANSSTPVIQNYFSTQSYDILKPVFNLNSTVQLSRKKKMLLSIEINAASTSTFSNSSDRPIFFHCPQADYEQNLILEECIVRSSETVEYSWSTSGTTSQAAYDENSFALVAGKNYIVDLVVYYNSDDELAFNNIPFKGRFLTFYNTQQQQTLAEWQISFLAVTSFREEISDAAQAIQEQNEKENAAVDNIDNQDANNIGNSSDQQTTSIIGTISSFVGAFSNVQPSSNCNLTLPFPEFLGGNTVANICQGKEKAPALITIGSSLLLIVTFVPLAFIMLRMIYLEIRSFTNG